MLAVASQRGEALRPWRVLSAMITLLQIVPTVAIFALVFVINGAKAWAYALAAVMLLLEFADWTAARVALGQVSKGYRDDAYRSRPLSRADRRLVSFNLACLVIVALFVVLAFPMKTFRNDRAAGALMVIVALAPGAIGMWRIRVHNSWRAVARIPGPPHSPAAGHGS
jgi:ABC-type proline/glycine betaine transport system permease subunit